MTLYTRIKHVARKTICFSCSIEVHEKNYRLIHRKIYFQLIGDIILHLRRLRDVDWAIA
ncbi:hypothetical protein CWD63_08270 [Raoultella ornithinolytica]|nr:hypothetical protein CWD63_08270 [Raoultella ornithinolytica]